MTGRKRRNGVLRYPSGKIIQEKGINPALIAALMPHRRNLPPECQNDQRAVNEIGRMLLLKKISEGQYRAGNYFGGVVARYLATIIAPSALRNGEGGFDCPATPNCPNCECAKRKNEFRDAMDALLYAGRPAAEVVWMLVVNDYAPPHALRSHLNWGLSGLKTFFGVKE